MIVDMKTFNFNLAVILLMSLILISGCSTIKPRVNVYKNEVLNDIFYKHENLAIELSRIPGVNAPNSRYLKAMKFLYKDYRGGYAKVFSTILNAGHPEERAYSAHLEALLWIYTDEGGPAKAKGILKDYKVESLLEEAWGKCKGERWDEWGEVRMRLSTPALVTYYTRNALRYIPERNDGRNYAQTPYETLLTTGGDCEDFAILIVESLEYSGYKARLFTVDIVTKEGKIMGAHTVATYVEEGKYYFIQGFDGKYLTGEVKGPFAVPLDMANFISESVGGVPLRYYVDTIQEFIEGYRKNER
jgi:transglutaminase superfamily protein